MSAATLCFLNPLTQAMSLFIKSMAWCFGSPCGQIVPGLSTEGLKGILEASMLRDAEVSTASDDNMMLHDLVPRSLQGTQSCLTASVTREVAPARKNEYWLITLSASARK